VSSSTPLVIDADGIALEWADCLLVNVALFRVARYVEWCGHGQELIPVPDDAEWVRLVPVIGTAT